MRLDRFGKTRYRAGTLLLGVLVSVQAAAQVSEAECGRLQNAHGPYDYRTATQAQLDLVERFHFYPAVETLDPREGIPSIAGNLDYTLRVFPNHHRALSALSRLATRFRGPQLPNATYPTDCYFERAVRFQPSDPMAYLLLGLHLLRTNRATEAIPALEKAASFETGDPNIDYNLGLAYLELKQYDKALQRAKAAYAKGWPLPGLRDRLRREGHWRDE